MFGFTSSSLLVGTVCKLTSNQRKMKIKKLLAFRQVVAEVYWPRVDVQALRAPFTLNFISGNVAFLLDNL